MIKEKINPLYINNNNNDMYMNKEANILSDSRIAITIKGRGNSSPIKNINKNIYNNKEAIYSQTQEYQ